MCGIFGSVGLAWGVGGLDGAAASLRHRGPDDQGLWCSPGGQVLLGHARLSIIDLSPSGHQPMSSHDGRYHLIFNGEIYNYLELRQELGDYPFRTRSDAE